MGGGVVHHRAHPLNVRIEATLISPVRVRHTHPEARALTTDVTNRSHNNLLNFVLSKSVEILEEPLTPK